MRILSAVEGNQTMTVLLNQKEARRPITTLKKMGFNPETDKMKNVKGLVYQITVN